MLNEKITQQLTWLEMPDVPGLSFRRFRGEIDFPLMLAVITESKDEDGIERVDNLEDIKRTYAHLTNCDPYQDMVFAEVNNEVVGYARVTWWTEQSGLWAYSHFGFLKPAWRRRGIGRTMLRICQQRLKEIAAQQLESGERPAGSDAQFRSWASDTEKGTCALLESEGFQAIRRFYTMQRPDLENIPDLPLPAGIEVRPVDWQNHKRLIFDAEAEAFRDHWGYSPPTEESYQAWIGEIEDDPDIDPSLWRVAWDGDQVAGMVRSFILGDENEGYNRLRGYTEHISVRRPWRKQGLARALIALSLQALKERGMQEAALGVDTQNTSGALRIYEFMGFRPVKIHIDYSKSLE
jgi:mycothiol synthase